MDLSGSNVLSIYPPEPQRPNFDPSRDEVTAFHKMSVLVRVPGIERVEQFEVLDDSASSYLELFRDDCILLGFDRHFLVIPEHLQCGYERTVTANGIVRMPKILVELQFVAQDGTPIGEIHPVKAVLPEQYSWERPRCSGQALRMVLFTAPGHIGHGNLYTSQHGKSADFAHPRKIKSLQVNNMVGNQTAREYGVHNTT
ncbi:hypothetical protein VTN77DRAFT_7202 [Rasamsonia byssochlamydoides]|uniref:uncharacterized protein n=1 Tax=Rasamsonia byssochlamydoides TaxID=89139 RepID=UPI00374297FF